ncbi:MAG: diaminopimelate epimerase, partial [Candidatus Cloacimonetes bacterium]|nr:diaminopimelate epimerase [Candidatus Cloacimonadota bacterium]
MILDFIKMQAQGNDYVYLDLVGRKAPEIDWNALARKVSDRHFGIGSDGLVLILDAQELDKHHACMRIFNQDGSEAEMCGSALRCISAVLHYWHDIKTEQYLIETNSGVVSSKVVTSGDEPHIEVVMGQPKLIEELEINGFSGSYITLGNPHFIVFFIGEELPTAEYGQ